MSSSIEFIKNVHNATNEAVLQYFDDAQEIITHYTSPNGFIGIIQNKELWFGNINNVNDIEEVNYAFKEIIYPCINKYNFFDSKLRGKIFGLIKKLKNRKFSFVYDDKVKNNKAEIFVFSTSLNCNSTMLWTTYCKNSENQGYAISFEREWFSDNLCACNKSIKSNSSINYLIEGKVIYDRDKQIAIVNDYLNHLEYAVKQQESNVTIQTLLEIYIQKFLLIALFMKDTDFDKEQEYRYVIVADDELFDDDISNPPYLVFGTHNGSIVSRLAVPFSLNMIRKIAISPYIIDGNIMETTRYFLTKNGIGNVTLDQKRPKIRM